MCVKVMFLIEWHTASYPMGTWPG